MIEAGTERGTDEGLPRYIAIRIATGLLALIVVTLITSFSVELLPGDLATAVLGQSATPENTAAMREKLGLDRPPFERYIEWLTSAVQGNFGVSLLSDKPVSEILGDRLYNTLFLAGLAAVMAVPLALLLGILAALYRRSWFDRIVTSTTLTSISSPEFFVGYALMLFLVHMGGIFEPLSDIKPDMAFSERIYYTMMPALTLMLVIVAHMMRMTRASIINLLASPYIEMARLKGVSAARVILVHALPNALAPIINVIALNLAYLITSAMPTVLRAP
jgi:peptide/nickel transport system permease protein